jgi:transposase InsO family protein
VDGGSEFQDAFQGECQRRGAKLFVLPPRLLKLNRYVERAQRTHTEKFYEVTDTTFDISEFNRALLKWEQVYNTVSPHQALGYFTPQQFVECYQHNQKREVMCY